ncbi:MAG: ATP-binding protein [Bacteroidota bacterium]
MSKNLNTLSQRLFSCTHKTDPVLSPIANSEKRRRYFFKVIISFIIASTYIFGLLNFYLDRPLMVGLHNLLFGVLFTICLVLRKWRFELILTVTALLFQVFIFIHAYYLLPAKQMEIGLGILTCLLPIFVGGFRLWYFFISNFILYHLILFSVDYAAVFYFKYSFYVVMFIMTYTIVRENRTYEKKLFVQKDKIQQDAQELLELDELKTRFFANVSHELRTPLTLVLSPIESILNSQELSDRNTNYLRLMQKNGEKLRYRINELLELSRLDANKLSAKQGPIAVHAFTKRIVAAFEGEADLKNIQLNYINELPEDLYLSLDGAKLEIILTNFLSNALKFTLQGGNIDVTIRQQDQQLHISVQDSGIGIPTTDLPHVFKRFYQVKGQAYQVGSGIGLALCKELAELQKGKVGVKSELGQGSTFFVELPFVETDAPSQQEEELKLTEDSIEGLVKKAAAIPAANRPTILVVEDNTDLQGYLQLILSDKYQVKLAENGQVALDYLNSIYSNPLSTTNPWPSLIISDIMMPVMDGMELLKQLKASENWLHLPFIMLTAQQHTNLKIKALRIGVDDYLTKPFKEVELLARVDNLIQNKQLRLMQKATSALTETTEDLTNKLTAADLAWLKTVETKILDNVKNTQYKLSDLAAELFITPRTLQTKIKKITGQTPKQYQRNIQLDHARKILKSGAVQTVSELSYELGFEDASYFSRIYKKAFGVSPREELDLQG